ncbi:MAG: hypothetical protein RLZZ416_138 [Candidatus Parcubacteria bacterium]|jgi:MFS family permease
MSRLDALRLARSRKEGRTRLLSHRFLFRLALGISHVFAWIFIFQYLYLVEGDLARALARVALLFALSHTTLVLATPLAARMLRHGVRRSIVLGVFLAASGFALLGVSFQGVAHVIYIPLAIVLFAILLGLYRAFYWIPYEIEAHDFAPRKRSSLKEIIIACAPAVGGLLIAAYPASAYAVLYAGAALMLLSLRAASSLPEAAERFPWSYRESFMHLMARENHVVVSRAIREGMIGAALMFFWPIAIFTMTNWSYGVVGVVLTITFLAAIFARALVREAMPTSKLINALLIISPWIMRVAVATPLGIVLVDSYFYTASPVRYGLDPFTFEQAADAGLFLDEYTALKEMGLAIGRITVAIIGSFAALSFSFPVALVLVFAAAALVAATGSLHAQKGAAAFS